eukprot:scaffold2775_cov343-Prasinococcus_capsulatus_cf.AAC.15
MQAPCASSVSLVAAFVMCAPSLTHFTAPCPAPPRRRSTGLRGRRRLPLPRPAPLAAPRRARPVQARAGCVSPRRGSRPGAAAPCTPAHIDNRNEDTFQHLFHQ